MQGRNPSTKSRNRIPSLRRHKPSGLAVVTLSGKDLYCGSWGDNPKRASKVAREEYDRLTALWLANGRQWPQQNESISIARMVVKCVDHAEAYYRRDDGKETSEVSSIKSALKPIISLYGPTDAASFRAADLKAVRQQMIDAGRRRIQINRAIGRIVRAFRWATENGIVPASVRAVAVRRQMAVPRQVHRVRAEWILRVER